ncbi:unnamed protein product [Ceratitis capitata]|uniref:(Mediterranean fruit fly) hypothetical protein n=1 Tax=Ceratitis capitata TaxID=7213 RepID=A0A811V8N7_CERCA|nr:unnamed protein product [Ceratitis capitata]
MSSENFEELTDVELRRKLLEYEFPYVPITETSREFLVKKLKNHVRNLRSRKVSTKTFVTQRDKQELKNLLTQANDWSKQTLQRSPDLSETLTPTNTEQSICPDTDYTLKADQLIHSSLNHSLQRNRTHRSEQQVATLSDNDSNGFCCMIWKVFGTQENYTNCVWWSFALFFVVIAFIYMMKSADFSQYINKNNTNYVICERLDSTGPFLRPPFVCIERERLDPALVVVRKLMLQLKERYENHYCYDQKQSRTLSVSEFIRSMFEEGSSVDMRNVREAQYLITCNPQWNIRMIDHKGSPVIFNGVDRILPNHNTFFVLKRPQLSLACLLYHKAHQFKGFIGNASILMCLLILFYLSYRYVCRVQEQHLQAVQNLLDNIVEELQHRAADNENSEGHEVVIDKLRDQLLPSNKHICEMRFWNEALKELESKDSRVHFDFTMRDGHECRTIRWVDTNEDQEKPITVETNC